jgi:hypothetical protein
MKEGREGGQGVPCILLSFIETLSGQSHSMSISI